MKIIANSIFVVLFSVVFVSCLKERSFSLNTPGTTNPGSGSGGSTTPGGSTGSTPVPADLNGVYDFISVQAKITASNEYASAGDIVKTVTVSDYTSQAATGTITIAVGTMTSKNLGYSINTVSKGLIYENGILTDSLELPLQTVVPPSNSVVTYTKIGTDSMYFQSGSMFMAGATLASKPGGMKLTMENGLLLLNGTTRETTVQQQQGERVTMDTKIIYVARLKKK